MRAVWSKKQTIMKGQETKLNLPAGVGVSKDLLVVANRAGEGTETSALNAELDGVPLIGQIPYDPRVMGGLLKACGEHLEPTEVFEALAPRAEEILAAMESA